MGPLVDGGWQEVGERRLKDAVVITELMDCWNVLLRCSQPFCVCSRISSLWQHEKTIRRKKGREGHLPTSKGCIILGIVMGAAAQHGGLLPSLPVPAPITLLLYATFDIGSLCVAWSVITLMLARSLRNGFSFN